MAGKHAQNVKLLHEAEFAAREFSFDANGKGVGYASPIEVWKYQRWCRALYNEIKRLRNQVKQLTQ